MNIALIMMGGSGIRLGAPIPKQFIEINGEPIFGYLVKALNAVKSVDKIIIVVHKDWIAFTREYCTKNNVDKLYVVTNGGSTRSESVLNGLMKASEFAKDDDVVMMFDTTHPYVDEKGIDEVIETTKEFGGATLGQRQFDTCYQIDENDMLVATVPRQEIVSGASPEAFLFKTIFDVYTKASREELDKMTSAGAIALAHNIKMKICTLNNLNLKITYPTDIELLKYLIDYNFKEAKDEK